MKATIPGGFKYFDGVNTGGYNGSEKEGEARGAGYQRASDNAGISGEVGDIDVPGAKARAIKAGCAGRAAQSGKPEQ